MDSTQGNDYHGSGRRQVTDVRVGIYGVEVGPPTHANGAAWNGAPRGSEADTTESRPNPRSGVGILGMVDPLSLENQRIADEHTRGLNMALVQTAPVDTRHADGMLSGDAAPSDKDAIPNPVTRARAYYSQEPTDKVGACASNRSSTLSVTRARAYYSQEPTDNVELLYLRSNCIYQTLNGVALVGGGLAFLLRCGYFPWYCLGMLYIAVLIADEHVSRIFNWNYRATAGLYAVLNPPYQWMRIAGAYLFQLSKLYIVLRIDGLFDSAFLVTSQLLSVTKIPLGLVDGYVKASMCYLNEVITKRLPDKSMIIGLGTATIVAGSVLIGGAIAYYLSSGTRHFANGFLRGAWDVGVKKIGGNAARVVQ